MMTLHKAFADQRVLNNDYKDTAAWKLGGTNQASSSHFKAEHLFYGPLKRQQVFSCSENPTDTHARLAELEITFRLNRHIDTFLFGNHPTTDASSVIDSVMPSVELPYSTHDLSAITLPELIIDNCAAGALIIGHEIEWDDRLTVLFSGAVALLHNKESVTEGNYQTLLKSPLNLLTDFLELAKKHNLPLKEGQLVATGGISPCVEIDSKKKYEVNFNQLGTFGFSLT